MSIPGYAGHILHVDLTEGAIKTQNLNQEMVINFIGGLGINSRLAFDFISPDVDPLSPQNAIILGAGPFTGTMIPGASKLVATVKFPQNGAFGSAAAGCRFPLMLKSCGYDHLIVTGRAPRPMYLFISDEGISLEEAGELWGMDIYETTDHLMNQFEPCSVLPIGPAGENLVRISITLVDKGGTLGSGGFPAIMGSKNLKAIVVKQGKRPIRVARKKDLLNQLKVLRERMMKWSGREVILQGGLRSTPELWWGNPPARTPMMLDHEYMSDQDKKTEFQLFLRSRRIIACPSCPMADKECIEVKDIRTYVCHLKQEIRGGVKDPEEDFYLKVKTQHTADRLGICLHTYSGLIGLLTALREEGVLTKKDLGVELDGSSSSLIYLMKMTTYRKGIGDILADGFPRFIKEFGQTAEKLALHNKGRYILWDPRVRRLGTMEFGEFTNTRGSHLQAGGSPSYAPGKSLQDFVRHADRMGASPEAVKRVENKGFNPGRYTKLSEDWFSLLSSLGLCNRAFLNRFYSIGLIESLYSSVTGLSLKAQDLMVAAERGWNLMRLFNLKAGFTAKDDKPPDILFTPLKDEKKQWVLSDYFGERITRADVHGFLSDYYEERGWDKHKGVPTPEKLERLGLKDFL